MNKIFYVTKNGRRFRVYAGTLKQLTECFSYTLECGHSWNAKIKTKPSTFKSLLSNLDKSVNETQGSCYERDSYWEATESEIQTAKNENCLMVLED